MSSSNLHKREEACILTKLDLVTVTSCLWLDMLQLVAVLTIIPCPYDELQSFNGSELNVVKAVHQSQAAVVSMNPLVHTEDQCWPSFIKLETHSAALLAHMYVGAHTLATVAQP
jgi:hypothetical protein